MMDIMGKTAARTNDGDAWLDDYFGRYKAIIAGATSIRRCGPFTNLRFACAMAAASCSSQETARAHRSRRTAPWISPNRAASAPGISTSPISSPASPTISATTIGWPRPIEFHAGPADAVVLISVSGKSPSVVNAARHARSRNLPVVAFTGSGSDNPLRALADIDFWVESRAYNIVECVHMMLADERRRSSRRQGGIQRQLVSARTSQTAGCVPCLNACNGRYRCNIGKNRVATGTTSIRSASWHHHPVLQ